MNTDKMEKLRLEIVTLIEKYRDIPAYEIGHQLIYFAVSMLLFTAPNELLAIKTILASVENGIADYEGLEKKKNE